MTELLLFLTGTTLGATAVHAIWRHHAELHHWDRYRVEAGRFDVLCHDNDHLERLNQRLSAETDA